MCRLDLGLLKDRLLCGLLKRNKCWIWKGGNARVAPFGLKYRVKSTGAGRRGGQDKSGCPVLLLGGYRVTAEDQLQRLGAGS